MNDRGMTEAKSILRLTMHLCFLLLAFLFTLPVTARGEEWNADGASSSYLNDLNRTEYAEDKAPDPTPVFRWDFSGKKVAAYSFQQEVITGTEMDGAFANGLNQPLQSLSTKGALLVKSKGDGTAELVITDMKSVMQIAINRAELPKTMEREIPSFSVQGMKEDGTGSFGDNAREMFLKMIFPLPTRSLKVGESIELSVQIPFNAMGSRLQVTGHSRFKLTRYVRIGNRTCAQFDVEMDTSDLKVPAELKGEYTCSGKGSAVYFFDVRDRIFVSGTTAFLMQFHVDAPVPKMTIKGEMPKNLPERMKMVMKSDNYIRISLQE